MQAREGSQHPVILLVIGVSGRLVESVKEEEVAFARTMGKHVVVVSLKSGRDPKSGGLVKVPGVDDVVELCYTSSGMLSNLSESSMNVRGEVALRALAERVPRPPVMQRVASLFAWR